MPTAGKSGTAELGGKGEPHSWFIGFAPVDNPTVAIAVLVERGGRGGERAAPLAGEPHGALLRAVRDALSRGDGVGCPHGRHPRPARAERPGRRNAAPRPTPFGRRPLIERLGLAVIALGCSARCSRSSAVASFVGGEPFLGVMGAIGCLMVLWVGGLTLFRG